jgi:hypothetical protein
VCRTWLPQQREVVSAFLRASRDGDLEGLVSVPHPDVVLRTKDIEALGARTVAGGAGTFRRYATTAEIRFAVIGGEAGFLTWVGGVLFSAMAFTVRDDKIAAIHVIQDKEQLTTLI